MIFHWRILDLLIMKQMCFHGTVPSLSTPSPCRRSLLLTFAEISVSVILTVRDAILSTEHRDLRNRAPDPSLAGVLPQLRCPGSDLTKAEGEI